MEFLRAMRELRLGSVLAGDKEKIAVADRINSRGHLHVHYGNSKGTKHFAVWSLFSSSTKTDADKRGFLVRSRHWLVGTALLLFINRNPRNKVTASQTGTQRSASAS